MHFWDKKQENRLIDTTIYKKYYLSRPFSYLSAISLLLVITGNTNVYI